MYEEICCLLIGMGLDFATDDEDMTERHLGEYFCLPDVHRALFDGSTAAMQLTQRISSQHRRGLSAVPTQFCFMRCYANRFAIHCFLHLL